MKTKYLLPNYFIKIGLVLFLLTLGSNYYAESYTPPMDTKLNASFAKGNRPYKYYFFKNEKKLMFSARSIEEFRYNYKVHKQLEIRDRFDRINFLIFYLGMILIVCSKLKIEDELISKLRLESLIWTLFFCGTILAIFRIYYEFNPQAVVRAGLFVEYVYVPDIRIAYYVMIAFAAFLLRFNYVVFLKPRFLKKEGGFQNEK